MAIKDISSSLTKLKHGRVIHILAVPIEESSFRISVKRLAYRFSFSLVSTFLILLYPSRTTSIYCSETSHPLGAIDEHPSHSDGDRYKFQPDVQILEFLAEGKLVLLVVRISVSKRIAMIPCFRLLLHHRHGPCPPGGRGRNAMPED